MEAVAAAVAGLRSVGEVVVVVDGSTDGTAVAAARAGARIVRRDLATEPPGKGRAMAAALATTDRQRVVFLDADVPGVPGSWVDALVAPLLADAGVVVAEAAYRRPGEGGGRVTELLARPSASRWRARWPCAGPPSTGSRWSRVTAWRSGW